MAGFPAVLNLLEIGVVLHLGEEEDQAMQWWFSSDHVCLLGNGREQGTGATKVWVCWVNMLEDDTDVHKG